MLGNKKTIKYYKEIKKPKPGEILIFPRDNRLLENSPYVNNAQSLPEWFKNIEKKKGSIRSCSGTLDFLQAGITVPLWTNVKFTPNLNLGAQWEAHLDQMPYAEGFHNEPFHFEAVGRCPMTSVREIERSGFPKLVNPWCFMTAPGWSTLLLPPLYEPNKEWQTMASVIHTDFYHNLNLVLNIYTDKAFWIKAGTPVMHLIPFKRNGDITKIGMQDESMWRYITSRGFGDAHVIPVMSTGGSYKTYQRKVDSELEQEPKKRKLFFWNK
jgi:hypothetical protein